jgi:hypothetical protein
LEFRLEYPTWGYLVWRVSALGLLLAQLALVPRVVVSVLTAR